MLTIILLFASDKKKQVVNWLIKHEDVKCFPDIGHQKYTYLQSFTLHNYHFSRTEVVHGKTLNSKYWIEAFSELRQWLCFSHYG